MTTFHQVTAGINHLVISWTLPQFPPYIYEQTTSCKLLCDHRTYYLTERMVNGGDSSSTISALQPGSVCLIKHLAVYNPASIDPGIGLSARTLYSSKCCWLTIGAQ